MKNSLLHRLLAMVAILALTILPGAAEASSITAGTPTPQWVIERVDAPRLYTEMEPSSLKLYGTNPRVAFGADHLYYAYSNSSGTSNWHFAYVDLNYGVGRYASLAVEPDTGAAHISYYDAVNNDLKYAIQVFTGSPDNYYWELTVVDSGDVNGYTSIALDSSHYPHIVYQKDSELWYARYACTKDVPAACSWTTTQLDATTPNSGFWPAIAIDPEDHVHVVHMKKNPIPYKMRYGVFDGATWLTFEDIPFDAGKQISLAVPDDGYPHIAYADYSNSDLRYAFRSSGGWEEQVVDSSYVYHPSLSFGDNAFDAPFIVYSNSVDSQVKVASISQENANCPVGVANDWFCDPVTAQYDTGKYISGVRGSDGNTYLTYLKDWDGGMIFARGNSSAYSFYTFPNNTSANVGFAVSLDLDTAGKPHFAYQNTTELSTRYARSNPASAGDCGDDAGSRWQCMVVDNVGSSGDYIAIAVNPDTGLPGIGYYIGGAAKLAYATFNGISTWTPVNVDTNSNPFYISQALDPITHSPRIAYFDQSHQILKYAYYVGSGGDCGGAALAWKCEAVTGVIGDGGAVSLAMTTDGKAVIAYGDAGASVNIAYEVTSGGADCGGTNPAKWHCDAVEVGITPIYDISLVLTSTNIPRVVYADGNDGDFNYASASAAGVNASWSVETIKDSLTGYHNDMALDSNGIPWVAYENFGSLLTGSDLMLAHRVGGGSGTCFTGSNWSCETIDSAGDVGQYPEIEIAPGNMIYIAYYDVTNGDLKLAYQHLPVFLPMLRVP
jgi:hypothetical protein